MLTLARPALLLLIAVLLGLLGVAIYFNALQAVPENNDFVLLYAAAKAWWEGSSLYQPYAYLSGYGQLILLPEQSDAVRQQVPNLNLPVVSGLVLPFALLPLRWAYYLWCAVQVVLGLWAMAKLGRWLAPQSQIAGLVLMAALLFYFPLFANLQIGQLGVFYLVPVLLGFLALEKGAQRQAGLWLGLALTLKLFTGLILVWLLLRQRWLVLAWAAAAFAVLNLVGLAVFGAADHARYLQTLGTVNWAALTWNASLDGVLERFLGGGLIVPWADWPWARWAVRSLAWLAATLALIWLARRGGAEVDRLGFALCLPLMLFLSPLGWIYYFPVLFISAAIIWQESWGLVGVRRWLWLGLALSAVPQFLASPAKYQPALWHRFGDDLTYQLTGTSPPPESLTGLAWPMLAEVYPIALLILCALPLLLLRGRGSR